MCLECRVLGALVHIDDVKDNETENVSSHAMRLLHATRSFDFRPTESDLKSYLHDPHAETYLQEPLTNLRKIAGVDLRAIKVDSDGSCLPYAVSRCLVGKEILYDAIRLGIQRELLDNPEYYRKEFQNRRGMNDDTWAMHWEELIDDSGPTYGTCTNKWLGPGELMVALSNSLARPVLLLDENMKNENSSGLFLPSRLTRDEVNRAHPTGIPSPIVIGWSSSRHNHFVSLIRCARDDSSDAVRSWSPKQTWNNVEKAAYGDQPREVETELVVPAHHQPGGSVELTDDAQMTYRVKVPLDKLPGDKFRAKLTRDSPPFEKAVVRIISENSKTTRIKSFKTMSTMIQNLADAALQGNQSNLVKFSKLKLDNPVIRSNVSSVSGALDLLQSLGFVVENNNELIFKGKIDPSFIYARDALSSLTTLSDNFMGGEGEIMAGQEAELFGSQPACCSTDNDASIENDGWSNARELYACDNLNSSTKKSTRSLDGVWLFGSGRNLINERKQIVQGFIAWSRSAYEDLAKGTPAAKVDWDDVFVWNRRLMYCKCKDCGEDQEWSGPIDGPLSELHRQDCEKCAKALKPEWTGARTILDFVCRAAANKPWPCKVCGKINDGTYVECWSCCGGGDQ